MNKLLMTTMLIAGFMMISSDQKANALMTYQPIATQQSHVTPVWWRGGGWHPHWGYGHHRYWVHPWHRWGW